MPHLQLPFKHRFTFLSVQGGSVPHIHVPGPLLSSHVSAIPVHSGFESHMHTPVSVVLLHLLLETSQTLPDPQEQSS